MIKGVHPDKTWKQIFLELSLQIDREEGFCAVCGAKDSDPFEPQMCYLCVDCVREHPLRKGKMNTNGGNEDDILALTGIGPFRTQVHRSVGYDATAEITVKGCRFF